jgi:putative solute:sodium symporter small subunit
MSPSERHRAYWRRNVALTAILLFVWFAVSFVAPFYARELNAVSILGFPLGFYMGAQGALIVYVAIIWLYARYMNRLDDKYGQREPDDPRNAAGD